MEALLKEQELVIRSIIRVLPNYKKLGKDNFSKATAEERLRRLRIDWERCQQVHLRLEVTAIDTDRTTRPYFKERHFERAEAAFEQASDFFCDLVESLKVPMEASASASIACETSASASHATKLPRIEVPKFDGRYSAWPTFCDLFSSLVVTNSALDDVQRLYYLKGALEGRAASVIAHVKVTAANFPLAWKAVQSRYDNRRITIGALVGDLLQSAPLTDETGEGLERLRDGVAETLSQLANLSCPTDKWDDLLVPLVVRNLDRKSREEWELSLGASREPPTYRELDSFLEARVRALEAIRAVADEQCYADEERAVPAGCSSVRSHTVITAKSAKMQCPKCSRKHLLFRCPVFSALPTAQKREFVKTRGCCFNCLRTNHSASSCPSASRCARCGRPHHSALHQTSPPPSNAELVPTHGRGGEDRDEVPPALPNCTTRASESSSRAVLLATAVVRVATRGGATRVVRALLDQGSEATFVSESLVRALRLPKQPVAVVVTGAGDAPVGKANSRVDLTVQGTGRATSAVAMTALVLRRVTSYIPRPEGDVNAYTHLRGLTFADPDPSRPLPVDLLIGADHFGALLRDGLCRGAPGTPIAQETAFGWVVSGPTREQSPLRPRAVATSLHCWGVDELKRQQRPFRKAATAAPLSPDETQGKVRFKATVARRADGRYVGQSRATHRKRSASRRVAGRHGGRRKPEGARPATLPPAA